MLIDLNVCQPEGRVGVKRQVEACERNGCRGCTNPCSFHIPHHASNGKLEINVVYSALVVMENEN